MGGGGGFLIITVVFCVPPNPILILRPWSWPWCVVVVLRENAISAQSAVRVNECLSPSRPMLLGPGQHEQIDPPSQLADVLPKSWNLAPPQALIAEALGILERPWYRKKMFNVTDLQEKDWSSDFGFRL